MDGKGMWAKDRALRHPTRDHLSLWANAISSKNQIFFFTHNFGQKTLFQPEKVEIVKRCGKTDDNNMKIFGKKRPCKPQFLQSAC